MKRVQLRDRLAGCLVAALSMAATLWSAPANAQCTLIPGQQPLQFEPRPPGAVRTGALFPGFSYALDVYQAGGSNRMMMMENWGFSILDLSNPGNPTALAYHDMRSQVPVQGDGQSYVASLAVVADGSRALLGTQSPSGLDNVLMQPAGMDFTIAGDFTPNSSTGGLVVQKLGSRYMGYSLRGSYLTAADITTFLPGDLRAGTIRSEATSFLGGTGIQLAGPYLLYRSGSNVVVINASNPGPTAGSYLSSAPNVTIPVAAWGRPAGESLRTVIGAVDPADGGATPRLYLLGEFALGTGSTGFRLMALTGGTSGTLSLVGDFVPPAPFSGPGSSVASLLSVQAMSSDLVFFMWARVETPTLSFKLYTKTAKNWGAAPGEVTVDPAAYPSFGLSAMRTLATGASNVYA